MMDANQIIDFISNAKKSTPVKVYVKGSKLDAIEYPENVKDFIQGDTGVLFGEWKDIEKIIEDNQNIFDDYVVENDRRNSGNSFTGFERNQC